jgi:hypothetical protein
MSSSVYLSRSLSSKGVTYTEADLLSSNAYVVVLAEPGGGKTELMNSLARQLDTTSITASRFVYEGAKRECCPLMIDAYDELAKIDATGIHRLLAKASESNPTHVYISSRSSEWDNAATHAFSESLGHPPLLVTLCEFNENEQKTIFDQYTAGEDFIAFKNEVVRFDLGVLLPNPQFLKLFADAYIESNRHFNDKRSIFAQAVERLAKEANANVTRSDNLLSTFHKVELASETFAKLLLSGAEGVCTSEAKETRMNPFLASLFTDAKAAVSILATRLFKPGDSADQHRPVHKIVAEYCAADYLTKRIADPTDYLTLDKCLPIIAPNSTVRDELRGLLGWMAALGTKNIEEAAIELDPYSVLANGDPSQIEHSSKLLLLKRLKVIEAQDPYFRRGDFWRRFSISGFFTQDVVKEVRTLLLNGSDGHLRDLLLELLSGSPAIVQFIDELRQLMLTPGESLSCRMLANRCLLGIEGYDHRCDLSALISEASNDSLSIAADIFKRIGTSKFELAYLASYFRVCANLYPGRLRPDHLSLSERFFLKHLIASFELSTTEGLLDELTRELACICGKKAYECDCRNGISKIVGSMLDHYFTLATPPFDPLRVWQWVNRLNFHGCKGAYQSNAIKVLQQDSNLRQGIITHVFRSLTERDQIIEIRRRHFDFCSHSGLTLAGVDYRFLVDMAFESDNPVLWASFLPGHRYYQDKGKRDQDVLRRHMRQQALEKPSFMRKWSAINKAAAQQNALDKQMRRSKLTRKRRRHRRQQQEILLANRQYVQDNRSLVESGRHLNCLVRFAELVLNSPETIEYEFGDETLVRNALRNCLEFLAPHIPDLLKLAEPQCRSKSSSSRMILYAACLEIMRHQGSLENVSLDLLKVLRTSTHSGYSAVSVEEREALETEVERHIFPDAASSERFLREYIEPQLAVQDCLNPEIWMLSEGEAFSHLRAALSVEWLSLYRDLTLVPLNSLFEIAAKYGNRDRLKEVISERCANFISGLVAPSNSQDVEQKRTFWFVRAWYFLDDTPEACWDWLKADKHTVLLLYERSGGLGYGNNSYWPKLTSVKVEAVLDAFIDQWPKVYLPSHWGTESPDEEKGYRFLTEVIWSINSDDPDYAIPVLERLLVDPRLTDLHRTLKSIHASQLRNKALRDFEPPSPKEIVDLLDRDTVVTVEGLRKLVLQELKDFQKCIDGGEFNSADRFYEYGKRLDEVRCTLIIAERLSLILGPQGVYVTPEHQLKNANRCDFTASKVIGNRRRLLVTEVKGQWHDELYSAASAQLHERYSIHPEAEQQGIYLVIWFGEDEKVAGKKRHGIGCARDLRRSIEASLPQAITGLIDVFVLDVSKPTQK